MSLPEIDILLAEDRKAQADFLLTLTDAFTGATGAQWSEDMARELTDLRKRLCREANGEA